jgi:hypothetical protein
MASTFSVFLNFEGKIGLWDGDSPPTTYSDNINFEQILIKPQTQDTVNLTSRMANSRGAVISSVNNPSDTAASVEIEASTFTNDLLALMLGSEYQAISQTDNTVIDEPVNLVYDAFVKLNNQLITSVVIKNVATTETLPTSAYTVDERTGLVKLTDQTYEGASLVSYSVSANSWMEFASGVAASEYVHITGETVNQVTRKRGTLNIWKASLKSDTTFNPVGGDFLRGSLSGDLITPSVTVFGTTPTRPWVWRQTV